MADAPEQPAAEPQRICLKGIGKYIAGAFATIFQPLYAAFKIVKGTLYQGLYKRSLGGVAKDYAEAAGSYIFWPFNWLSLTSVSKGLEGTYNLYTGEPLPWD